VKNIKLLQMIISQELFKPDTSDKAKEYIQRLNNRRGQLVYARKYISSKMAKGYLDYQCINKNIFNWRFETVYNDLGEVEVESEDGEFLKKMTQQCSFKSAEQYYNQAYFRNKLVQNKIDDYHRELISRDYSLEVKSIPYQDSRYVITNLIKQKFETPEFKDNLSKAVFDSMVKGTGFLRPIIYDNESEKKILNINKKGEIEWETVKTSTNSGLTLERLDPETVFVDPGSSNPKELFICTPYEVEELLWKYPSLSKYIPVLDRLNLNNAVNTPDNVINRERLYNYHVGELLYQTYELASVKNLGLFDSYYDTYGNYITPGIGKETGTVSRTGNILFDRNKGGENWNDYLSHTLPTERIRSSYIVNEYYNVEQDLYVVYIGNIILWKSAILEPFKDLPIIPIYTDNKHDGYYGTPLTEKISEFQDEYNYHNHLETLATKVTGKPFILVDDSRLNTKYHTDGVIELSESSPINFVHMDRLPESGMSAGSPMVPIPLTNGGSESITQNRKNTITASLENQFPSLKQLVAGSSPEMQRDMIWSRDLQSNEIMRNLEISLSKLAYITFIVKTVELQKFRNKFGETIPSFETGGGNRDLVISFDEKEEQKNKQDKIAELTRLYENQIKQAVESMKQAQDPNAVQIMNEVRDSIQKEVVTAYLQKMGNSFNMMPDEEKNNMVQGAVNDPAVKSTIDALMQEQGMEEVDAKLSQLVSSQITPPVDMSIYINFGLIKNWIELRKEFVFSFKKSLKEQQQAIMDMLNTVKPLADTLGFYVDTKELMNNIITAYGFNPEKMLIQNPAAPNTIATSKNAKLTEIVSYDKNYMVYAQFLNDKYGKEIFTPDMLMEWDNKKGQMELALKQQEISTRNVSKAQTDIIKSDHSSKLDSLTNPMPTEQNLTQPQENI